MNKLFLILITCTLSLQAIMLEKPKPLTKNDLNRMEKQILSKESEYDKEGKHLWSTLQWCANLKGSKHVNYKVQTETKEICLKKHKIKL